MSGNGFLKLDGADNFRDLGGRPAADGKTVKKGVVFRSDDLCRLSDADLNVLADLPIRSYIDFRTPDEVEAHPDREPSTLRAKYVVPIDAAHPNVWEELRVKSGEEVMRECYLDMVHGSRSEFARFFEILAKPETGPLVFHCAAGKDRTGLAAMFFLSALGAPSEAVMDDYLLSAGRLHNKYAHLLQREPRCEPLITARAEYLEASLSAIESDYGGLERYLTHELKADIPKLRSLYTE